MGCLEWFTVLQVGCDKCREGQEYHFSCSGSILLLMQPKNLISFFGSIITLLAHIDFTIKSRSFSHMLLLNQAGIFYPMLEEQTSCNC